MMNEELGIKVCVNNAYYYLGEVKVTRNPLFLHTRQKKFGPPSFLFSLFSSYGIETLNIKKDFFGEFSFFFRLFALMIVLLSSHKNVVYTTL